MKMLKFFRGYDINMLTGKSLVSENTCKIPLGQFKLLYKLHLGLKLPVMKLRIKPNISNKNDWNIACGLNFEKIYSDFCHW